ncbi:MAG: DUF1203 domain-containing protein [Tabrizicola sp.]|nr:DUF1203 domain-containing protein [Tabrizicola sp.]
MTFQIKALQQDAFAHLFELDDDELAARKARRQIVTAKPGTPCRVSMEDAEVGETVILLNYEHQPGQSPFQSSHAVFVRENAQQVHLAVNEVPQVIRSRLISLRFFDQDHMMLDAEVVAGDRVATEIARAFENDEIAYAHIHYAKPGCFAATAHRAD